MDIRPSSNGGAIAAPDLLQAADRERASAAAWYALWILVAVVVLRCIDQVVLTIATEPMRKSLALSDTQLGSIQGIGMTLALAIGGLPIAWLADRYDRRWVLGGCIVFWSLATALRGFAQSFEHVLLTTVGMSLAEASLYPIAYAIIPTLFRGSQRTTANLIFYAGGTVGYSAAMLLGGLLFKLIESHGHLIPWLPHGVEAWRIASFFVGAIGPALAVLVLMMKTQDGGPAVRDGRTEHSKGELMAYLRQNRRCIAGILGSLGFNMVAFATILAWLPPAAARAHGLTPAEVGNQVGLVLLAAILSGIGTAALFGRIWGAALGDLLALRTAPYLSAVSALAFAALGFAGSLSAIYAGTFLAFAPVVAFSALLPGVYQAMAPAAIRVRFIALASAVGIAFSASGPLLVGYVSDQLHGGAASLLLAISLIATPMMVFSALLAGFAVRPTQETLARVRAEEVPGG